MRAVFLVPALLLGGSDFLGGSYLRADAPVMQPLRKPAPVFIHTWGGDHSNCAEWTNSCVICQRNEAGAAACSTPGIACQPRDIVCKRQIEKKP